MPGPGDPGRRSTGLTNSSGTSVILVVGASSDAVSHVVQTTALDGWKAVGTTDAWEAIDLVARLPLSLIVLDPEVILTGGSDFYTLLRDDPGLQEIPVILTAEEHQSWLLRGLDVLLDRPVEAPVLRDTVRRLLISPFPPEEDAGREERFVCRRRAPLPVL
jgi:hypothetical protein